MIVEMTCVVEGQGESQAVRILIERIAGLHCPDVSVDMHRPVRQPASKLLKAGGLEQAVNLAAQLMQGRGGILVLLDCEDDAPCELGPQLLARARDARPDVPLGVVLVFREYETWFLAAAESLRGQRGLPNDLLPPHRPEAIRGAKEWLGKRMASRGYSETADQPAFTARFDLAAARNVYSFDKCYREVTRLLDELREKAA